MLFSCIIPVYNTDKNMLQYCIQSIKNQSFTDFEIIIVDDGSKPDIADYCERLIDNNFNMKVLHKQNGGLADARNYGIKEASGEWLIHIDADDWIDCDLLENLEPSCNHPGNDIVIFGFKAVGKEKIKNYALKNKSILSGNYLDIRSEVIGGIMLANKTFDDLALNTTWGKTFKRSFVNEHGLKFDISLRRAQDVIYNLNAFYVAENIEYVDVVSYNYRVDNTSLSRGYNESNYIHMTNTAKASYEFANSHDDIEYIKNSALAFCRRCFRSIVYQDFTNNGNKQTFSNKRKRFIELLETYPYKQAFAHNVIKEKNVYNKIESLLISRHCFTLLVVFIRVCGIFWR